MKEAVTKFIDTLTQEDLYDKKKWRKTHVQLESNQAICISS